jgi:hypothetical protein|tara:strand:- start:184 stop:426 length:243 start_codon:yes stop_codon:yes gene_type:complete
MKHIKAIILFFVIYFWVYALTSCSALKADELNCETFVNEKICNMSPEEQEKWFWELFQSLIEEDEQPVLPKSNKRETIAI